MNRAAMTLGVLAMGLFACGPDPEGVGFTGIGNDPVDVARSDPFNDPRLSTNTLQPAMKSDLPVHRVSSNSTNPGVLAGAAIANAGKNGRSASSVRLGDEDALLSIVDVGGSRFLVARAPRGVFDKTLDASTDRRFVAAVAQLTGCFPQGGVYRGGKSKRQPQSLAVELSCL
jgi:hypothetical protein